MKLKKEFYLEHAPILAKKLIGKNLCVNKDGKVISYKITETEAYFGEEDTACHAKNGKTKRNAVMYEQGGVAYVYLCYGIHALLNVVCGEKDFPEAVLIRAVEGFSGPGKLTKNMGIDLSFNGISLLSDKIYIEDAAEIECVESKRVGIDYADEYYRNIKWNFKIKK